ncbi:hypothetical protein DQ04_00741070 [Trypanosoma grayi]|uniref:hypothetical protein n=1 Tax=Trypanosoma grayi TaxID=71804 RepID=UPI0004F42F0E|nr:hypothetical protein DQ04_00741070 [Trypanosoma grayi]KEG13863.1 hypothetical protein DQ04_00741070 [Trypanosoma grayi]
MADAHMIAYDVVVEDGLLVQSCAFQLMWEALQPPLCLWSRVQLKHRQICDRLPEEQRYKVCSVGLIAPLLVVLT